MRSPVSRELVKSGKAKVVGPIYDVGTGKINWLAGGVLALGNMTGAWLGAHFAVKKGERLIRWILNSVLVVFIVKLLLN